MALDRLKMIPDGVWQMKIVVPDYYEEFHCIADKCRHTCCQGWEVEVDADSMLRYEKIPEIYEKIECGEENHIRLSEDEVCPFLEESGLCTMIKKYGEGMLCQTCTDHPRFRNFWSDRIEMGVGLVCEEAGRLILSRKNPMKLVTLSEKKITENEAEKTEDGEKNNAEPGLDEDEKWLLDLRDEMLSQVSETGPMARFKEYLIYRHIPDALYDDRLMERIAFIDKMVDMARKQWDASDGTLENLVEIL